MGKKLLLADDSITIQKVVGIIFANEDYELTVVDNGNAALEKARELIPDIIMVDALMPGKTGYEVCEAVRGEPALRHVPLLLLTGAFEPFDEGKARESGADDFISKPFESQQLIDKVKTLIELGTERHAAPSVPPEPVAAAVSVQPPVEPAAEPDVAWETFADADAFAAEPEPVPAASTPTEDILFADMSEPAVVPPATASFETEVVEVSADDDLWGAFDLEEMPEDTPVDFETAFVEEKPATVEEVADDFVFGDELEDGAVEPATVMVEAAGDFGDKWLPVDEQTFDFQEETSFPEESAPTEDFFAEPATVPKAAVQDEMAEFAAEPPFASEEESVQVMASVAAAEPLAVTAPDTELQFAPEEDYVSFAPPEETVIPSVADVAVAAAAAAVPTFAVTAPAPALPAELSEEQLTTLVAKISKDIIERIAWEVVPDLAENIIREEVRRLKEGA
ncbi:MAG: response regulator [Geobacter sp.]|nr:MAG: response regulator [Geobacter sp.]